MTQDTTFEVTQILATRFDSDNDEWMLVQWGCTWVLKSALADGQLLRDYLDKPKLSQSGTRVHIPIEDGTQTQVDADAFYKRKERKKQPPADEPSSTSEHDTPH